MPMKLNRDKYITTEEFKRILYALRTRPHKHSIRDRALITVCALLGLRAKELISIRYGDLRLSDEPPLIDVLTAKQREAKKRLVFDDMAVPPSALKALREFISTVDKNKRQPWSRVFRMTTRQAGRLFKTYSKIAGLNPKYSIHCLRHFRGMRVYEETKDLVQVRESLRHKNLTSTQIYLHAHDHHKINARIDVEEDEA